MNDEQREKLKDILFELADQMHEVNPGLPNGWLTEMIQAIEQL